MTHASSLHAARRRWPLARWVAGIVLALCVVLPVYALATGHAFMLALMTRIVVLAIAAVALNLVLGFGGMVSFGHALFLGLGVYSAAIPAFHGLDNGLLHLLIALAACGLTGLATGAVALRTQGIAFIMITLAFAQMSYFFFVSLENYGGDDGMRIASGTRLGPLHLQDSLTLYYTSFLLLCAALFLSWRLVRSRFGMVIRGARSNQQRMAALGFPTFRYRLTAYVISAVICALAGVLLANLTLYVSPAYTHWTRSGELLVMVILGGLGTLFGPLVGAVVLLLLEDVIAHFTQHWQLFLGPILILVVLFARGGLLGLLAPRGKAASSGGEPHG